MNSILGTVTVNAAKGVYMLQLSRDLDCQYKTAFVLAHKLREAIAAETKATKLRHTGTSIRVDIVPYPTVRAIADVETCDKSYVSRLLSIALLAPDIVKRILTGDHAATLTPERLRKACPLPARWENQRAMLLD
jgi:hypothetical protein